MSRAGPAKPAAVPANDAAGESVQPDSSRSTATAGQGTGATPPRTIRASSTRAPGRFPTQRKVSSPETVRRVIADRMARDHHLVVALDPDPEASYGAFIRTFDAVKQAKADRIQLNVRGCAGRRTPLHGLEKIDGAVS